MRLFTVVSLLAFAFAASASAQVPGSPSTQSRGSVQTPAKKPNLNDSEFEAAKARAANEAREKAWDLRTKRLMSTICTGC
jgi:hypothetical protein